MNLNKVILIGRITQDPEIRNTQTGQTVASFSLATNRVWNNQAGQKQEQVEFHNIIVWRRLAEIAGQYLKKGQLLMVEGHLQTRNWTGQDGIKKYRTEIIAENFQMGPKSAGTAYNNNQSSNQAPANQQQTSVPTNAPTTNQKSPQNNQPANIPDDIPVIQIEDDSSYPTGGHVTEDESEIVPF